MNRASSRVAIINDVLLLYEFSLAIGTSLDLRENCAGFLDKLQSRKNFSRVIVWLADSSGNLTHIYANPRVNRTNIAAGVHHPLLLAAASDVPLVIHSDEQGYEQLYDRSHVNGCVVLYPLKNIGVLELFTPVCGNQWSERFLNQLSNVLDKFAVSLNGSLSHQRLQMAEKNLKDSENCYRALVENLPQRFFLKDLDSRYISCSQNYANDLGLTQAEIEGHFDVDFFPSEIAGGFKRDDQRIIATGITEEIDETIIIDGEELQIHTVKAPARDADGKVFGVLSMFRDATEEKQAREQVIRLVASVEHAQDAIIISDLDSRMQYVNPAFEKMTGYSAEEAVGRYAKILRSGKHPRSFYVDMLEAIQQGRVWRGEMIIKCKNGSFRHVERNIAPVRDDKGNIICQVTIQRDITEHKEMEEQFQHAQKMESLGVLVGGVAHEFNNALAAMTGRLFLLKRKIFDIPSALNDAELIETQCFRSADMVAQMLAFARKSPLQKSDFDLTAFVKETLKLHRLTIPESIHLHTCFCSHVLPVHGDMTLVQQIIVNLLNNARDALQEERSPEITIELNLFEPDDAFLAKHPDADGKQFARLSVYDNGCGISQEELVHIFDPFYTTKEIGKGTGLGLAMVYGACAMHDGYIDVVSVPGSTSLHVCLPVMMATLQPVPEVGTRAVRGQGELILLVDDEDELRGTAREVLEELGYLVLEATDGAQAVDLFIAHQSKIQLIIMDVVMPHMGGMEAAEKIQQIRSEVPVIYCTGYDKSDVLADCGISDEMVITKPYNIKTFSNRIRNSLHHHIGSGSG